MIKWNEEREERNKGTRRSVDVMHSIKKKITKDGERYKNQERVAQKRKRERAWVNSKRLRKL